MKIVLIIIFAALLLLCLSPLFYLLFLTISDIRDTSKAKEQNQDDIDKLQGRL